MNIYKFASEKVHKSIAEGSKEHVRQKCQGALLFSVVNRAHMFPSAVLMSGVIQ